MTFNVFDWTLWKQASTNTQCPLVWVHASSSKKTLLLLALSGEACGILDSRAKSPNLNSFHFPGTGTSLSFPPSVAQLPSARLGSGSHPRILFLTSRLPGIHHRACSSSFPGTCWLCPHLPLLTPPKPYVLRVLPACTLGCSTLHTAVECSKSKDVTPSPKSVVALHSLQQKIQVPWLGTQTPLLGSGTCLLQASPLTHPISTHTKLTRGPVSWPMLFPAPGQPFPTWLSGYHLPTRMWVPQGAGVEWECWGVGLLIVLFPEPSTACGTMSRNLMNTWKNEWMVTQDAEEASFSRGSISWSLLLISTTMCNPSFESLFLPHHPEVPAL